MHQSSLKNMKIACEKISIFSKTNLNVLDVGGRDLNQDRSYYSLFQHITKSYHIADIAPGEMVTHLMTDMYTIPAESNYYDLIVSGQTIEHVKNPFKLVLEMKRVLKKDSFIILIAPSAGPRHDIIDCWRIMDDGFKAIAEDVGLEIIDDWVDRTETDKNSRRWCDHVFIGRKNE